MKLVILLFFAIFGLLLLLSCSTKTTLALESTDFFTKDPVKASFNNPPKNFTEEDLKKYFATELEKTLTVIYEWGAKHSWNSLINLNSSFDQEAMEAFFRDLGQSGGIEREQALRHFDYKSVKDPVLRRQIKKMGLENNANGESGSGRTEDQPIRQLKLTMKMIQIFNSAKICPFNNQSCDLEKDGLALEPAIHLAYAKSQDLEERKYLWTAWRNATGRKLREPYIQYVDTIMESAKLDNYSITDRLLESYECPTFRTDIEKLFSQVRPLYEEIHGYVRYKLGVKYPQLKLQPQDPIPAHLLGNLYADSWSDLSTFLTPFPNAPTFDITEQLKKKFTPDLKGITEMFDFANEFYVNMGLLNMSSAYGPNAMIMKPTDREVDCHPQSKSISKDDHRISMCTTINQEDLITIFHELGHIQYDMSYRNQPYLFRNGANPGFHEAIGDVISLSAVTPKHLAIVGLVTENNGWSNESDLNYLMTMALEKIVVIPFSYLVDTYRWKVFDGEIDKRNLTYAWLKMRNELQGVVPPIMRDEKDFDPGAKYHVAQDMPFIPYFVSHILQFQLFKAFCETANEYPAHPLYQCDFYGNKEVGAQFRTLLEAGSSKQWQVLLNETIGESKLDAGPILEYFAPLYEFLKGYRAKMNYPIGWRNDAFEDFLRHDQE